MRWRNNAYTGVIPTCVQEAFWTAEQRTGPDLLSYHRRNTATDPRCCQVVVADGTHGRLGDDRGGITRKAESFRLSARLRIPAASVRWTGAPRCGTADPAGQKNAQRGLTGRDEARLLRLMERQPRAIGLQDGNPRVPFRGTPCRR